MHASGARAQLGDGGRAVYMFELIPHGGAAVVVYSAIRGQRGCELQRNVASAARRWETQIRQEKVGVDGAYARAVGSVDCASGVSNM